jgi:hypothetical protein
MPSTTGHPDHLTLVLRFPPLARDLSGVAVHVVVEDVGEADVSAPRLGGADFTGLEVSRALGRLQLELDLPDLSGALTPAIRVHVDRSGAGRVAVGDFINPSIVEVPREVTEKLAADGVAIELTEVR